MSTIVSNSRLKLNTSETVRNRGLVPKDHQGNDQWGTEWSNQDSNTLRAQYLENSWRCY